MKSEEIAELRSTRIIAMKNGEIGKRSRPQINDYLKRSHRM